MENLQAVNNETFDNNDDEFKAQEKINQRREARRRNILENAKNRLERLNGRTATITANNSTISTTATESHDEQHRHEHTNGANHLDNTDFSDPEVEPDIIPQQLLQNDPSMEFGNLFSALNTGTTTLQKNRHILLRARVHLIISAFVACILTFILRETITNTYSVFIPAGLCVIIDLLFFREQQPLNPIINLVITICNIRLPSQTKNILHLFSIIQSLIVDLGVFVFSFCLFSYILVFFNDRLFDLIIIK